MSRPPIYKKTYDTANQESNFIMDKNRNKTHEIKFIILLTVLINLFLSTPVAAHSYWEQGVVTKAPWQERYIYIKVNNKLYTFMPEATFALLKQNHNETYNRLSIHWQSIKKDQIVSIKTQGRRIYQLIIQK